MKGGILRTAFALRVWGAFVVLALPAVAESVDPFYTELLRDGLLDYNQGDHEEAVKSLELACFGLLEEPPLLTEGLVYLALAHAKLGQKDEFEETYRRILEVEDRFSGYQEAELDEEVRQTFEGRLLSWIPRDSLLASATFERLLVRSAEEEIAQLPIRKQVRELERRIEARPTETRWRMLRAELAHEEGDHAIALKQVEAALEAEPDLEEAHCLRGLVLAEEGRCSEAIESLGVCEGSKAEPDLAEAFLGCRVTLEQWSEARELIGTLPARVRKEPPVARLIRQVKKAPKSTSSEPSPNGSDVAERSEASPTAADEEKLEEARVLLDRAQTREELAQALVLAREVADAHPEWAEAQHLVGTIAYRASRWSEAATYFRLGGDPGNGKPHLLFYMAVSYYEAGDPAAAAQLLERCLPHLQRSSYVTSYVEKILNTSG